MPNEHSGERDAYAQERRFSAVMARYERHRRVSAQHAPLGSADLRLLWLLTENGPGTLKQIGEELRLEQSTVNRQVNAAIAAGIVERTRAATGAAHLIEPTVRGAELLEASLSGLFAGYRHAFTQMGAGPAGELVALLGSFIEAYERPDGADGEG